MKSGFPHSKCLSCPPQCSSGWRCPCNDYRECHFLHCNYYSIEEIEDLTVTVIILKEFTSLVRWWQCMMRWGDAEDMAWKFSNNWKRVKPSMWFPNGVPNMNMGFHFFTMVSLKDQLEITCSSSFQMTGQISTIYLKKLGFMRPLEMIAQMV